MEYSPTVMADDEETVEHAELDRGNREEFHCRNGFAVVVQKRQPPLRGLRISGCSTYPARDRSLRNIKTDHQEFAVNALIG